MKKRIEKLVPVAIKEAGETLIKKDKNGNNLGYIPKEFKGYISSFGASVIQSGLIPTLAFFSNDEGSKENRSKILDAIFQILELKSESNNLLKYVVDKYDGDEEFDKELLKEKIMDTATALKLAIRTYKLD